NEWTAPDLAVWGIIIPGFLLIPDQPVLRQAAGNILGAVAVVYLFQGLAVLSHIFARLNFSPFFRAAGYVIIALQPFLLIGLWAVGLFDTWADFRKLRNKPDNPDANVN
ncbi:MAG TPA: DUF2232 domain-containing protein, partial [Nitrospirota bacterium]